MSNRHITLRRCQRPWESREVKRHWHSTLKLFGCSSYCLCATMAQPLGSTGETISCHTATIPSLHHLKRMLRNVLNTAPFFISASVSLMGTVWHAGCSISKEKAPAHTQCLFSLLSRHFPPCHPSDHTPAGFCWANVGDSPILHPATSSHVYI